MSRVKKIYSFGVPLDVPYTVNYNLIVDTGFRSRSRPDPGYFAGTGDVTSGQLRFQRTLNILFF